MKGYFKKYLSSKDGMTLVELMVSLAIFSILTLCAAAFLVPSFRVYTESTNLSRSTMVLENVLDRISDELKYAIDIEPGAGWTGNSDLDGMKEFEYESQDYGKVKFTNQADGIQMEQLEGADKGKLLFSQEFYIGNRAAVSVKPVKKEGEGPALKEYTVVCVTAVLYDKGGNKMGSQKRYVNLLNTAISEPTGTV